jgi:uncharacterized repeat protein (TIGR02543 family)
VITHTVIFLDWDGSGIDTVQVENGLDAIPPNDPIREGYIFTGWDTEYTNVTQDLIITAQYSIIDYNINYELDGGVNSINNPTTYTIEENIIFDVATKEGYSFDGWFTTIDFQNGTEVAEISQGSTGNVDIWAKFTLITGINNAVANKLTLYPNPVINGILNIDCDKTINEIKIFDLSGTLILCQTVNYKQSHSINIDYLESGVYFVKIAEKVFKIIKE